MLTKTSPVKVKAGPDSGLDDGQFEAIVSVFGNVDSYGDRVIKGAFADTLKEWAKAGDPLPVIWTHDHTDPYSHIGVVLDAKETNDGLWVKGQLDIDAEAANPKAQQVYKLLKAGRVRNWSYAYDVMEQDEVDGANELQEIKLYEVGPTLVGANTETETLAVKSAAVQLNTLLDDNPPLVDALKAMLREGAAPAGALPADTTKSLTDALDQISEGAASIKTVLADLGEKTTDDQETASGSGQAEDEDAEGVKSSAPSPRPSAHLLAAHQQLTLEGAHP